MKSKWYYQFSIGKVGIAADDEAITNLFFPGQDVAAIEQETELIKKAHQQLKEYFAGQRRQFELPLKPVGTEFQRAVWQALATIPYGQTCSYKDVAAMVSSPKAFRAVGLANNRNPISIIIPCHRVIGSDGKLVGYGGGLPVKEQLLALEQKY